MSVTHGMILKLEKIRVTFRCSTCDQEKVRYLEQALYEVPPRCDNENCMDEGCPMDEIIQVISDL